MSKKNLFTFFLLATIFFLRTNVIGAQTTNITDLGISIPVNDTNVVNGDIVCSGTNGYKLCNNEYDSSIYGIIDNSASAAIQIASLTNGQVVVSKGEGSVRVSGIAGNIKVGDFLTSSKTPGVAELATKQGFVIGTALETYSSNDKNAIGTIKVSINIHPRTNVTANTKENLIELLRNGLAGLGIDPISALRYLLAAGIVLVSLITGFIYFGRIAKTGVEAVGRNPLAGFRIESSVVINILIMLIITGVGLAIAYLILAL